MHKPNALPYVIYVRCKFDLLCHCFITFNVLYIYLIRYYLHCFGTVFWTHVVHLMLWIRTNIFFFFVDNYIYFCWCKITQQHYAIFDIKIQSFFSQYLICLACLALPLYPWALVLSVYTRDPKDPEKYSAVILTQDHRTLASMTLS